VVIETEKFHNLMYANWGPWRSVGIVCDLRTDDVDSGLSLRSKNQEHRGQRTLRSRRQAESEFKVFYVFVLLRSSTN
jgi:hypothetical protein